MNPPPDRRPERVCARCGTQLDSTGACPRCLLELGFSPRPPTAAAAEPPPRSGPPMGAPPELDEVRAAFPELEVEGLIGRGGMGAVFKARQPKLARWVALKVLPRSLGAQPAFAERFLREARALARLSHPGIVAVHDFGERGGLFYLSMEFVEGLDLRRLMRPGPLGARQALAITRELCDALQYAHDEGVVHRDIKPENVLLDARGRVKVADFGLAKLVDPSADTMLTRADQVMGTPHYMAPEQLERPRDVDHRADLFALGVVLYEMLTGSLPRGSFEPPSQRVRVDVKLDEIVLKALAREPERRYQHALDVKSDVEHVCESGAPRPAAVPADGRRDEQLSRRGLRWSTRAFPLFLLCWIALASLWNAGAFLFGFAIPSVLALIVWVVRPALLARPELATAPAAASRARQSLRAAGALLAVTGALAAIHLGQWALWELGAARWKAAADSSGSRASIWIDDPWKPARQAAAPTDAEPRLLFEHNFLHEPFDPGGAPRVAWYALILLGFVLLALATYAWLDPERSATARRRALRIAFGLAGQAALAWVLCWLGARAFGSARVDLSGLARSFETAHAVEETVQRFVVQAARSGLDVDVDQRMRVEDARNGRVLARCGILRAQAASPFERWGTSLRGASRQTPQVWASFVQPEGSQWTTVALELGLYPRDSAELAAASATLDALIAELRR